MKSTIKFLLPTLFLTLILPHFFTSCAMSPDDMLTQYNKSIYENTGNGDFITENGPNISKSLIPLDVYPVAPGGYLKIEINKGFVEYKWTLKNNITNQETQIDGFYIVCLGSQGEPRMTFDQGEEFTLTVLVKNKNGLKFTDTAKIKVYN